MVVVKSWENIHVPYNHSLFSNYQEYYVSSVTNDVNWVGPAACTGTARLGPEWPWSDSPMCRTRIWVKRPTARAGCARPGRAVMGLAGVRSWTVPGPGPPAPTAQRDVRAHEMLDESGRISNVSESHWRGGFAIFFAPPQPAPPMIILTIGGLFTFFANNPPTGRIGLG